MEWVFIYKMADGADDEFGIRNGQIELNRLYVFKEEPESDKNKVVGQLERTENPLINRQKLERKGLA